MSENSLNDFDPKVRQLTLRKELDNAEFPEPGSFVNAHAHTPFSPSTIRLFSKSFCSGGEETGIGNGRNRRF